MGSNKQSANARLINLESSVNDALYQIGSIQNSIEEMKERLDALVSDRSKNKVRNIQMEGIPAIPGGQVKVLQYMDPED